MSKVDVIIFLQRFILETKFRHKKCSARRVLSEYVSNLKLGQQKVDGPICGLIRPRPLKIKINNKFIEYMKSFGLSLNNTLNRDSTNAKTQIDYCFTNVKGLKSDYFESLTSFHKPIWIRKNKVLTKFHFDETEDIHTNIPCNTEDVVTDDQSDIMEVDEKFVFEHHETVDKNEQIDLDMSFYLEDL